MTHAIVLIEAQRQALASLGGALAELEGVGAAYSVTGEWDFVALVHAPRHEALRARPRTIAGVGAAARGARRHPRCSTGWRPPALACGAWHPRSGTPTRALVLGRTLSEVVAGGITGLSGVVRTQTMVAFEAFSRHDLEALFSIGS